jgi:tetratricopeptide (TPR) repeat protein
MRRFKNAAQRCPEGLIVALQNNLQQLLRRFPNDNAGRLMLATFYMHQQRLVEALSLLESISKSTTGPQPQVWYSQAIVEWQLEREAEAKKSAGVAADQFLQLEIRQSLTVPEFLQAIRVLVLANREDEALQLVESRLRLARNEKERATWLPLKGEICAAWSRRLGSREGATPVEIARSISLLFEGIKAAPGQPTVVDELCRLCISDRVSLIDVDGHLQLALNAGVSPGLVHFILGSRAATQSPPDEKGAEEHFQLAVAHDANFPGLLNNMANLIADSPDGDYQEGLKLVQEALKMLPDQPEVHDTHGKVLLKLGRPRQAIVAFEKALAAPAIRSEVHSNLAKAWLELGDHEKAEFHTKMAESPRDGAMP